jgi:hypothetical protein
VRVRTPEAGEVRLVPYLPKPDRPHGKARMLPPEGSIRPVASHHLTRCQREVTRIGRRLVGGPRSLAAQPISGAVGDGPRRRQAEYRLEGDVGSGRGGDQLVGASECVVVGASVRRLRLHGRPRQQHPHLSEVEGADRAKLRVADSRGVGRCVAVVDPVVVRGHAGARSMGVAAEARNDADQCHQKWEEPPASTRSDRGSHGRGKLPGAPNRVNRQPERGAARRRLTKAPPHTLP